MAEERTNAAIKKFKNFLRSHPEIVEYVHENGIKWRDVFDDWVIFGEKNDVWKKYGMRAEDTEESHEKKKSSTFSLNKMLEVVDTIDTKQWQERLDTISGALTGIRSFIGQFQQNNEQNKQNDGNDPGSAEHPSSQPSDRSNSQNPFFF
ncbi:YlbD family protein [Sporolactobacillus shoreicorticis]|uniref:YlbD family protein n=1 Tax=Sporolactobacillus shoreicorticis TaxID=1923877 RepID=A0ABW5S894_9BACL|nr:YlbD family protein [Sporolactobacillus shoreicorticis]MCO7126278.1 YlbD family protein [Sporolactobacillus shoreicorticis]